jgi:AF1548-like, C-terminal
MIKYIIKASGEKEKFSIKKFKRSLEKSGASSELIKKLIKEIQGRTDLKTTYDIYKFALQQLGKGYRPIAARYNLKNALIELGPTGFPFEQFVGYIFEYLGYIIKTDQNIQGFCVVHEIDVIAHNKNKRIMIECKFHNHHGLKTNVKVPLYVHASFDDVKKKWQQTSAYEQEFHQAGVVTNTKLTSKAIAYGTCTNMLLLSWSYPHKNNLAEIIDKAHLHPITCLTSLKMRQKKLLIQKGWLLCKDVQAHKKNLEKIGLSPYKIKQVIDESKGVCKI